MEPGHVTTWVWGRIGTENRSKRRPGLEGGVHVDGVPQDDAVDDEAERAELVLHAGVVALVELALVAVEHQAGERVAAFLEVADRFDVAAVSLVVEVGEDVQALEDPPVGLDRLALCTFCLQITGFR